MVPMINGTTHSISLCMSLSTAVCQNWALHLHIECPTHWYTRLGTLDREFQTSVDRFSVWGGIRLRDGMNIFLGYFRGIRVLDRALWAERKFRRGLRHMTRYGYKCVRYIRYEYQLYIPILKKSSAEVPLHSVFGVFIMRRFYQSGMSSNSTSISQCMTWTRGKNPSESRHLQRVWCRHGDSIHST